MVIQTTGRIWKVGNSYVVTIPKQYLKDGRVTEGSLVQITVQRLVVDDTDIAEPVLFARTAHVHKKTAPLQKSAALQQEPRECSTRGTTPVFRPGVVDAAPLCQKPRLIAAIPNPYAEPIEVFIKRISLPEETP